MKVEKRIELFIKDLAVQMQHYVVAVEIIWLHSSLRVKTLPPALKCFEWWNYLNFY